MWWALIAAMAMLAIFLLATWYLGTKYGNQPEDKNSSF
jgi:hypothetical protein